MNAPFLPLTYRQFLEAKVAMAPVGGFDVRDDEVNPLLKPHQRIMVIWACRGGRRAIFAAFGLGKTFMQLEILRLVLAYLIGKLADKPARLVAGPRSLIVAPLGVRREFFTDARTLATGQHPDITDAQRAELRAWQSGRPERVLGLKFCRSLDQATEPGGYITNYESVRDGKLDPRAFDASSLDEASCLRGFGGSKTFREFMRLFEGMRFKFAATATPDPNEYIELLAYSAYLEIMDVGQGKTRFFKRNSEKADSLTIHPHKEREFWLWVASWGLFVSKPSDLGCSDDGYELPGLDVHWHEIAADHSDAGADKSGQGRLLKNAAASLGDAAREKRHSIGRRVAKLMELRALNPSAHRVIWHDLEAERAAIAAAIPTVTSVWGSQDMEDREAALGDFAYGHVGELSTKPSIAGQGCNFQRYCAWEVFLGIGFKFNDFIQAVHRCYRFLQRQRVRVDLIYTEAERPVRDALEAKWARHIRQAEIMAGIIREFGLTGAAMAASLTRGMGVQRVEVLDPEGRYRLVNNDCVEELEWAPADSVDLIVTSIPFSTQYEYSPNYSDFGHTDDDRHFWSQMDYLIPNLYRVLRPGRVACIHVKDRIVPGGLSGLGFQSVAPFSDDCVAAFRKHGFAFLSRITVTTDVVRENNQTYRLGWSEQCKDGSRMGNGLPEYVLKFRKPPTDRSRGYADVPVVKLKKEWLRHAHQSLQMADDADDRAAVSRQLREEFDERQQSGDWEPTRVRGVPPTHAPGEWTNPDNGYSRARWQLDANGYHRSSGDRLLTPGELRGLDANVIFKLWRAHQAVSIYDFENHVALAESLEESGSLPKTFALLPPHSPHPDVWSDIARMLSMNTLQAQAGRELHLCPLQFDIVDRCIEQHSQPGETVLDPFGGLMTVPFRALKQGRRGVAIELNPAYFADGVVYVAREAERLSTPSLLSLMGVEDEASAEAEGEPDLAALVAAEADLPDPDMESVE